MAAEQIMVEFVPDVSQVQTATEQLSEQERQTIAAGNAELAKRAQISKQNVTAYNQEQQAAKNVTTELNGQLATTKKLKDSAVTLGNLLQKAFEQGGQSAVDNILKQLPEDLKQAALATTQFSTQQKQQSQTTQEVIDKTESARSRLRAMREELVQMSEAGLIGTKAYNDLKAKAGELADAMADVAQVINQQGSDTRGLDKMIRTASLATAGFGVMQGAAALFGDENKELQKTLMRVNAIMLILNSLQQIQTELTRDDSVAKGVQIALQKAWTIAVGETTGALYVFRVALASTGIGLLVAGIGMAVAKLSEWISGLHDATIAQEKMKISLDEIGKSFNRAADYIENSGKIAQEVAKQHGATAKQIFDITQQTFRETQNLYKKNIDEYGQKIRDLQDINSALYKEYKGNEDARLKDLIDAHDKQNAAMEASNKAFQDNELAKAQFATEQYEKNKELAQKNAQAEEEISLSKYRYLSGVAQQIAADEKNSYENRTNALSTWFEDQKKILDIQYKYELSQPKLTAQQIKAIKEKNNYDLKALQDDYQKQSIKLYEDFNKKQIAEADADAIALTKARLSVAKEGTREELDLKNLLIRQQAQQQIDALDKSTMNEKLYNDTVISINADANKKQLDNDKQFYQRKKQLAQEYTETLNHLIIASNKLSVAGLNSESSKVFETEQKNRYIILQETNDKIAEMQKQFTSGELQANEENMTKYNKLLIEQANTEVEIAQAAADRKKKIDEAYRDAALQVAQDLADAIFDIQKQNIQNQLDEKINSLETQKNKELDNANLTEEQKKQISSKYDQLEKNAKRQAAQRQKQADITQAIINGILAVTKALASSPPPFNFINAAVVAAATAIDVAKIRATPIPQYAKGTKNAPRGMAWVGEEGPELIFLKGGERIISSKESNNLIENLTRSNQYDFAPSVSKDLLSINSNFQNNVSIDYDRLAAKIGKHVAASVPRHGVNIDENGFKAWVHTGSLKTIYKNKRYKLG